MTNSDPRGTSPNTAELPHSTLDVSITITLDGPQVWDVAQFLKRLRYSQVYELTDCSLSRSDREDQAYRMKHGLARFSAALRDAGYSPR